MVASVESSIAFFTGLAGATSKSTSNAVVDMLKWDKTESHSKAWYLETWVCDLAIFLEVMVGEMMLQQTCDEYQTRFHL